MKESFFIVTIGCPDLVGVLKNKGYESLDYQSESDVPPSSKIGIPRVFILRSTAIVAKSTEASIEELRKQWPIVDIVVWAPRSSGDLVLGVMKAGAKDVVLHESEDELMTCVEKVIHEQKILPRVAQRDKKKNAFRFEGIVSRDPVMWDIFDNISQIAPTNASVLILGETGTGKELIARAIHKLSGKTARFVAVNCAAIPQNLVNAELFGHVKGAFTGAHFEKKGLFRFAEGGSIFLDEIGSMPLESQYHLLRVLQEGCVRPVGAHEEVSVNVRVIAATSVPLEQEVANHRFREDLLYRLDVMRIVIPPLRDRGDDIIFLFSYFLQKFAKHYKLALPKMTEGFLDEIAIYPWPGNVRQLSNITERLILSKAGTKLTTKEFKKTIKPYSVNKNDLRYESTEDRPQLDIDTSKSLDEAIKPIIDSAEKAYLIQVLKEQNGKIGQTANMAGVSRRTILRKLNQWGIDKAMFKQKDSEK